MKGAGLDDSSEKTIEHSDLLFSVQVMSGAGLAAVLLWIALADTDTNLDTGDRYVGWIYLVAFCVLAFTTLVGFAVGLVAQTSAPIRRAGRIVLVRTVTVSLAAFAAVVAASRLGP